MQNYTTEVLTTSSHDCVSIEVHDLRQWKEKTDWPEQPFSLIHHIIYHYSFSLITHFVYSHSSGLNTYLFDKKPDQFAHSPWFSALTLIRGELMKVAHASRGGHWHISHLQNARACGMLWFIAGLIRSPEAKIHLTGNRFKTASFTSFHPWHPPC